MEKILVRNQSTVDILIVAAHPDDEVLGCGGTIAKHSDEGERVHILILAEGLTSRQISRDRSQVTESLSELSQAAHNSATILGAISLELLDLPDNRLDSIDRLDLIKIIEARIKQYRPHTVYLHHSGDVNVDHRLLHEAVVTACRPIPGHSVRRLLSYEVSSSTEWQPPGSSLPFQPNWFVDISHQWARKSQALSAYSSEMRPWPHARSIQACEYLAHFRGASVGVEYAEAFMLLRNIESHKP